MYLLPVNTFLLKTEMFNMTSELKFKAIIFDVCIRLPKVITTKTIQSLHTLLFCFNLFNSSLYFSASSRALFKRTSIALWMVAACVCSRLLFSNSCVIKQKDMGYLNKFYLYIFNIFPFSYPLVFSKVYSHTQGWSHSGKW